MKNKLTLNSLVNSLFKVAKTIPDHRSGGNLKYAIPNAISFAFSCFYIQQPSFLRHEENLETKRYNKNLKHLFPRQLHSAQTCRNILDTVDPHHLEPAFNNVFRHLDRSGVLRNELRFPEQFGLLLGGDGVDYFHSQTLHCSNCSTCRHEKGTENEWISYAHKAFVVNIIHPKKNIVIPLQPEFITPQDGHDKQDCERAAAKRWMVKFRKAHHLVKATILVDALHCNQPFFKNAEESGCHVMARCKEGSNPFLMDWIGLARKGGDLTVVERRIKKGGKFQAVRYEFLNDVPLKDGGDAIKVAYLSMTEIDPASGKENRFEYVTDHKITKENVEIGCLAGRKRWKSENEGNNTLKNHGYRFDHNYGHGKRHLSSVLATLILFVLLVHSILNMIGQDLMGYFLKLDSRQECFSLMRSLLRACAFESWDMLYKAMKEAFNTS